MEAVTISVVIPCYNQGIFLQETVNSVLQQTISDFEIVIVNDGSTDKASLVTINSFDHPKIRVMHKENGGVSEARNTGIAAARGRYIFALDADDLIEPTFLEKAVAVLEADFGVGLVSCQARRFGVKAGPWPLPPVNMENILYEQCIPSSCAVFRKSDWTAARGFDPTLTIAEDFDFWLSIVELGRSLHRIEECLFFHRVHEDSAISRFNKLPKMEGFKKEQGFNEYIFRKHIQLYCSYPEFMASRLFPYVVRRPKAMKMKRRKYELLLALYSKLSKFGLAESGRIKIKRKLDNLDFYDRYARDLTILEVKEQEKLTQL